MKKMSHKVWLLFGIVSLLICQSSISDADTQQTYDAEGIYAFAQNATFYIRVLREDGTVKDVGTGFVIDPNGTALTAYHVVEGAAKISGIFSDGTVVEKLAVVKSDEGRDIAVLKLPQQKNNLTQTASYDFVNLQTSKVRHGERVFAIGYPMKETKIITEGIVNSPQAPINGRDRILISAQIVSGMSGGPVLDKSGNAVGVISGSLRNMNNIHLVVDAEAIRSVMMK